MRARPAEGCKPFPTFGLVLQLPDLIAQKGVHHMQSFCGLREVQLLRHALQIHDRFIQVMNKAIKQVYWTYLSPAVRMIRRETAEGGIAR